MRRVEELAVATDRAQAAKAFAREIPGAMPLQWHFYQRLTAGDWLPHLAREQLLGEPLAAADGSGSSSKRFREWPAGNYLLRMADSQDITARKKVIDALRNVATSKHPDIQRDGIEILAALPPDESAPLVDLAVGWLVPEAHFGLLEAPENLLKKLTKARQCDPALHLARALLRLRKEDGEIVGLYGHHLYEHHLPPIAEELTKAFGEDALRLLVGLLLHAAELSGHIEYDYQSSGSIADDEMAKYDPYSALLSVVRKSAEQIVSKDPARIRSVISVLTAHPAKVFARLALHVLAQSPSAAPDLAETYLLAPQLIEGTWCQDEYGALARAWFPRLPLEKQSAVFQTVDAVPAKFITGWRERFEQHHHVSPTPEDERRFVAATLRDLLWEWRSVLPADRQLDLAQIVQELGDPNAWREQLFPSEVSPLSGAEFSSRPINEIVAFLKSWSPQKGQQRQTVTALAQELGTAVGNDSKRFAENADRFSGLKPIYIRRVLEGFHNAANNQRDFDWRNVLKLVELTYNQYDQIIDPATLTEGDDKSWSWACMRASELLAAGLRRGDKGISFAHTAFVRTLVFKALALAPQLPELDDFEERYQREGYFAAQATLRGIAVELCILLLSWLSKDTSTPIGAAPRKALDGLPDIRQGLENQLADQSDDGRVPRAIIGRYLHVLCYHAKDWLMAQMSAIAPPANVQLRRAAWRAHLGHDGGPLKPVVPHLRSCYEEDIVLLASGQDQRDFRDFYQKRLTDYVVILHLFGGLPEGLIEQFWQNAPVKLRQHAMWFVAQQFSRLDVSDRVKERALGYWTSRLEEAIQSNDAEKYRKEIGVIGQWCFHGTADPLWLSGQLLRMLKAGFVPNDSYNVVNWLHKIAPQHADHAVEVMAALLRHPRVDRWAYITNRETIRAALTQGLAKGTPDTVQRVHETVSFLSTIGETSYLDLVRPTAAE
jgi:hypothetical protein